MAVMGVPVVAPHKFTPMPARTPLDGADALQPRLIMALGGNHYLSDVKGKKEASDDKS
jgi:hypothetical protein